MKTKKRKINGLLSLLLILTLVLSACGNNQSSSNDNASETQAVAADSGSASAEVAEEPEAETEEADQTEAADVSGRLKMTLNGTDVVYAELTDTTATAEFLQQLPFTVDMHEHLDRQKEVYLPFSLSEESQQDTVYEYEIGDIVYWHPGPTMGIFTEHDGRDISSGIEVLARMDEEGVAAFQAYDADLENIQYPYEIGDIIYYPPGPTFAMYYDHDGREISAGMEVIARLDEEGVAALGSYEDEVKVTVELSN